MFPTDLLILATSFGSEGHCYIDTKNLDGETNLKYKVASRNLLELTDYDKLVVSCEPPHENMASFKGSYYVKGNDSQVNPLFLDHTLFRGCALRNTDWIIGLAIYTGFVSSLFLSVSSISTFSAESAEKTI